MRPESNVRSAVPRTPNPFATSIGEHTASSRCTLHHSDPHLRTWLEGWSEFADRLVDHYDDWPGANVSNRWELEFEGNHRLSTTQAAAMATMYADASRDAARRQPVDVGQWLRVRYQLRREAIAWSLIAIAKAPQGGT